MTQSALCFLGSPPPKEAVANQIFWIDSQESASLNPRFFHLQTPLQIPLFAKEIAWKAIMQELKVIAAPGWEEAAQKVEEYHLAAHLLLSEVADFGLQAFQNARANWEQGPFHELSSLEGSFQGRPAIICGAGPSLELAAPLLGALGSKALLIAAGSAIAPLMKRKVPIHLACALDKEAPDYEVPNVPCCVQSRVNSKWLKKLKGPKILAQESGPIPWEEWWLETDAPPSFGWTVGNFATQVALFLGCWIFAIKMGKNILMGKRSKAL